MSAWRKTAGVNSSVWTKWGRIPAHVGNYLLWQMTNVPVQVSNHGNTHISFKYSWRQFWYFPVADSGHPRGGANLKEERQPIIWPNFAENWMKMKK